MLSIFERPNALLRFEGLVIFLLAVLIYWQQAFSWSLFWSTVLVPDIAILGYLVNSRIGARLYNITHAKLLPGTLAMVAVASGNSLLSSLALIWLVHIGVDRMLGYGLKYPEGFKATHLGAIGQVVGESRGKLLACWK